MRTQYPDRRYSRVYLAGCILLVFALLFAGCQINAPTNQSVTSMTTNHSTSSTSPTTLADSHTGDLMAAIPVEAWPQSPSTPSQPFQASVQAFAARLLQTTLASKNNGNVMISPASVFLALAMTLNGADGETKQAMLQVLAGQGLSLAEVNTISRDWQALLCKTGSKTTLAIANAIFFRQSFQPDQSFLQRNADYFKAGASRLDFADQKSTDVINAWVQESTRGTIKKIVDKIPATTVMYLINSIYFKSDWQTPFIKEENREIPFQTPAGAVTTKFMHRIDKMSYFTGEGVSGVALPYDNGQFVYFAMLPDGTTTPRQWLAKQEPASLLAKITALMAQKSNFTVELQMPKFEVSFEDTLNETLSTLGMDIAFDGGRADFSLLNEAHTRGLYISEVRHKTYIRVDEKGTEAAAVTSVAIDESAIIPDVSVTLDRPFIYGIIDKATGIPLFIGILENPTAQ